MLGFDCLTRASASATKRRDSPGPNSVLVTTGEGGKEAVVATSVVAVGLLDSKVEVSVGSATGAIWDVSVAVAEAGRDGIILGAHPRGNSAAIRNGKNKMTGFFPSIYLKRFILEKKVLVSAYCRKFVEYL